MSDLVFPTLPGLTWDQQKVPIFKTLSHRAISGSEKRLSFYQYPLYQYNLSFNLLRDAAAYNELKTLLGFYLSRYGSWDDFLYLDPSDNLAVNETLTAISSKSYQLSRTYGGFKENCYDILSPSSPLPIREIYDNAVKLDPATKYTVNNTTGVVTLTDTPTTPVTANFSFYHRVRFIEYGEGDEGFNNFMYQLFELKTLSFITAR